MPKHIGTYRPGPYIFVEEAKILVREHETRGQSVFIEARYRHYDAIVMTGIVDAEQFVDIFKLDLNERCLLIDEEVFPCKNLDEIILAVEKTIASPMP